VERGVIDTVLTIVCLYFIAEIVRGIAAYCLGLWWASRRDRRKWDALARQEQREAVERALGDTPPPEDVRTIYW
jgi:membrane protein DedA with SNARE-associated domain